MRHPYFDLPTPLVLGHRGAAGVVPENTLASFRRGLECGAHIVESDVHATRDGVVVMCHDAEVDRTTDGRGRIAELSLEKLQRLDAGHRFTLDGGKTYPFRGRGLRIPTLREAFEAFPGVRFNLELKQPQPELVAGSVELVEELGRAPLTLLTSGDDGTMEMLRKQVAARRLAVAIGAATGDVVGFVRAAAEGREPPAGPMALQIPAEFAGRPLVTPELVRTAHAHDVQVHVWTINEPEEMHRLLDLGVDGIVTDHPACLVRVISERRG